MLDFSMLNDCIPTTARGCGPEHVISGNTAAVEICTTVLWSSIQLEASFRRIGQLLRL